jgi:hypothetical protein
MATETLASETTTPEIPESFNLKLARWWSLLVVLLIVAVIAYFAPISAINSDLRLFFTGSVKQIAPFEFGNMPYYNLLPNLFYILLLDIILMLIVGILIELILGKRKGSYSPEAERTSGKESYQGLALIFTNFIEEVAARWFFLGVLTMVFTSPAAFYVLFFISNFLWTWAHVTNYSKEEPHRLLRCLPVFIGGFFYSFIYVKYGFWITLFAHVARNTFVFATFKIEEFKSFYINHALKCGIFTCVIYSLMTKPLADITPWFQANGSFVLDGWTFWDYLLLAMFFNGLFGFIASICLFDTNKKPERGINLSGELDSVILAFFMGLLTLSALVVFFVNLYYGLFAYLFPTKFYVMLALILTVACMSKLRSGSEMTKNFWSIVLHTPIGYAVFCAIMTKYGFFVMVFYVFCSLFLDLLLYRGTFMNMFNLKIDAVIEIPPPNPAPEQSDEQQVSEEQYTGDPNIPGTQDPNTVPEPLSTEPVPPSEF